MIIDVASSIFDIIIFIIYFNAAFEQRKKIVPRPVFYLCFVLFEIILNLFSFYYNYFSQNKPSIVAISSIILIFALTFLYYGKMKTRIFVTLTIQIYGGIAEGIVLFSCYLLPENVSILLLNNQEYCTLSSKFILFLLILMTKLVFLRKRKPNSFSYNLLTITMPLLSVFILLAIPLPKENNNSLSINLISILGLLAANLINYFLFGKILQVQELKQNQTLLNQQLDFQINKYQQISSAYRNTRGLMHDTKKHFFYIRECIYAEKYQDILDYLDTAMQRIEASYNRINTGNLVIDSFISNHMSLAAQENITFTPKIQVNIENIQIKDYDLSIILGNLLDNSMQACRKIQPPLPKKIEAELFTTALEFVIHLTNSIDMASTNSKRISENELLEHGYGTSNVSKITLKYNGSYTHYIENETYHALVSIPCNTQREADS